MGYEKKKQIEEEKHRDQNRADDLRLCDDAIPFGRLRPAGAVSG